MSKELIDARTVVNDFVRHHSPKCRVVEMGDEMVNWGFATETRPLDFSLNWNFEGWGQNMNFYMKSGVPYFSWSSTERSMSNAVAFLSRANEVVAFGAKLQILVEELCKKLPKVKEKS